MFGGTPQRINLDEFTWTEPAKEEAVCKFNDGHYTREQAGELSIAWERNGLQLTSKDKETLAPYKIQSWA